jgi:hypothetical protein
MDAIDSCASTTWRHWFERVTQLGCAHDDVRRFAHGRVWLECLQCGRQTTGIAVSKSPGEQFGWRNDRCRSAGVGVTREAVHT